MKESNKNRNVFLMSSEKKMVSVVFFAYESNVRNNTGIPSKE